MRTKLIFAALAVPCVAWQETPGDLSQHPLIKPGADQVAAGKEVTGTTRLESYIEELLERWHTPGLAIAVIDGNDTWAKGFGRAVLPDTPVTPHTLFYTGSTTKSFTAAGLSLLVDNSSAYSSVDWTTPISSLLREDFVLSDDWATAHVTIEDALSHRTGYPRHDLSWMPTTRELVRSFRNLPMSLEPRVKMQYNNMMFATIGYLIEVLTGSRLGDFFRAHLWGPMGMNETYFGIRDPKPSHLVVAESYYWNNKRQKHMPLPEEEMTDEGAGAIISNVLDYTKYLRTMMAESKPMSKAGHAALKTPRIIVSNEFQTAPFVGPVLYDLGWFQSIFEGEQVWYHGGVVTAYVTTMLMIPSRNFGIVAMSNCNTVAKDAAVYRILYDHFGVPQERRFDFESAARKKATDELRYIQTCQKRLFPSLPDPPLPLPAPLANFTGTYHNEGYGDVKITLDCEEYGETQFISNLDVPSASRECRLRLDRNVDAKGSTIYVFLEPQSGDFWLGYVFVKEYADWETPLGCLRAEFHVGAAGDITDFGVDIRLEGEQTPLVWFKRVGL